MLRSSPEYKLSLAGVFGVAPTSGFDLEPSTRQQQGAARHRNRRAEFVSGDCVEPTFQPGLIVLWRGLHYAKDNSLGIGEVGVGPNPRNLVRPVHQRAPRGFDLGSGGFK